MADLFTPEEMEKTRQLLELFESNGLSELTLKEPDGFSVEISAAVQPVADLALVSSATPGFVTERPKPRSLKPTANVSASVKQTLNSPMVGIFYTSPSPGDPPFVSIGDVVNVGQTIGLIEAMKVFSEIPAETAGRIVEALALTGTLVQQAQPLFAVEPI